MGNLYAAIATITGLFLLGKVQMHASVAGYPFSCTILQAIAFTVAALALAVVTLAIRSVMRGLFGYATA